MLARLNYKVKAVDQASPQKITLVTSMAFERLFINSTKLEISINYKEYFNL